MRLPGITSRMVAPFTGAWIEIAPSVIAAGTATVAPFTGAWIEIGWRCVLIGQLGNVAPFTGAWIEIRSASSASTRKRVAPFTGAWIEIWVAPDRITDIGPSHPSRVRGLKYQLSADPRRTASQSHPSRVVS